MEKISPMCAPSSPQVSGGLFLRSGHYRNAGRGVAGPAAGQQQAAAKREVVTPHER